MEHKSECFSEDSRQIGGSPGRPFCITNQCKRTHLIFSEQAGPSGGSGRTGSAVDLTLVLSLFSCANDPFSAEETTGRKNYPNSGSPVLAQDGLVLSSTKVSSRAQLFAFSSKGPADSGCSFASRCRSYQTGSLAIGANPEEKGFV